MFAMVIHIWKVVVDSIDPTAAYGIRLVPKAVSMDAYSYILGTPSLYEAAEIDGCTPFGVFWKVVLPLSKPSKADEIMKKAFVSPVLTTFPITTEGYAFVEDGLAAYKAKTENLGIAQVIEELNATKCN